MQCCQSCFCSPLRSWDLAVVQIGSDAVTGAVGRQAQRSVRLSKECSDKPPELAVSGRLPRLQEILRDFNLLLTVV